MKTVEKIEEDIKSLEKQLSRLKREFEELRITSKESTENLKVGDTVTRRRSPKERGKVYKITRFRVAVLFENGKLAYYKGKNLVKAEQDERN